MNTGIIVTLRTEPLDWLAPINYKKYLYLVSDNYIPRPHYKENNKQDRIHTNRYNNNSPSDFAERLCGDLMEWYEIREKIESTLSAVNKKSSTYAKVGLTNDDFILIENDTKLRESNGWLYHIINNYDNLDDIMIFLQGYPSDHIGYQSVNKILMETLSQFDGSLICFPNSKWELQTEKDGLYEKCKELYEKIKNREYDSNIMWSPGAQFIVSKDLVLKHPKEYYERIRAVGSETHRSGEILERLWPKLLIE